MDTRWRMTRRAFAAGGLAAAAAPFWLAGRAPRAQQATELVHWSWLAASDGEVWAKMVQGFNDAHAGKGVQIRMEVIPEEQYVAKALAAAATGRAPDFGWGTAGVRAKMAPDGVILPLDDLAKQAGLDLSDFEPFALKQARYAKYGDGRVSRTHQQRRRCGAVREMREGPSAPAIRSWRQTAASCGRQERPW